MENRICQCCGKEYTYHGNKSGDHTKYCSDKCFFDVKREKNLQSYYRHGREKQKAKYNGDVKRSEWLQHSVPEGFTYLGDWEPGKSQASFRCDKHGITLVRNIDAILRNSSKSIKCPECRKEVDNARNPRICSRNLVDTDITLKALYKRDFGVCYLCGGLCDWSDKRPRKDSGVICGSKYPSIDHIIPLSKGGFHSWENIKLAHLICNMKKSNKMVLRLQPDGGTNES